MKTVTKTGSMVIMAMLVMAVVAGCSSGGGGGTAAYKIGGTVSGLSGTLVLQDNGTDDLSLTASGAFTFAKALANGSAYAVTIKTQPAGQTCSVTNGSGKVSGANVTNVAVSCGYTVGGTVTGLSGTLVLQDNGTDDLSITTSGAFTFATALANGSSYAVTVKTQPAGQTCSVTNGSGKVSGANVTSVVVSCGYTIGGTVSGLSGTLVLQNNGTDDLSITTSGTFTFAKALANGSSYAVTIKTQPTGQSCYGTNLSGTIAGANVTNVTLSCYNSGTLDHTFNSTGYVTNNNAAGGSYAWGHSVATDAQGRILVTGDAWDASNNDYMAIWRFTANGTLDTSFGTNGIVTNNNAAGGSSAAGLSIITDAQGRILVTGIALDSSLNYNMAIWRYNANGTLDTSFNGTGYVTNSNAAGGNSAQGYSIITDAQGRILVTGVAWAASNNTYMTIWRYNANGTLDTSFNGTGYVTNNNAAGGSYAEGSSIITDAQGRILVTGYAFDASNYDYMTIWRYNANGTLDTSFGTNGIVFNNNAAGGNSADGYSIITDAQGRILVTGDAFDASNNYNMAIWRYNANGTLDTAFNSTGIVFTNTSAGGNNAEGYSIITDAQGRILVTGYAKDASSKNNMAIWRFNANGTLDTSFGTNGIVFNNNAAGGNIADGLSIITDAQGRILVTGDAKDASNKYNMAIWRYIP
ncbi:MAG: hypothetical protein M1491_00265 [Deltaproteobacteria bacterium]|nr:hypothetical protein [Deltaproteobacteria bacterium]MCL5277816.1 hypothetical protein [Deltaproteobacteria bacterium]